MQTIKSNRQDLRDIWNAFLCDGARYCNHDIPFCPTTAKSTPNEMITWTDAKSIYKKQIQSDGNFTDNRFVCFYIDDYKFDGARGIWNNPEKTLEILNHFAGAITPDFSTCQDFPEPIKLFATYRMRAYGYWLGKNGIPIINNIRWGTDETYDYCFEGIPTKSIVCIGTVGGSPRKLIDRSRFEKGFFKMIEVLEPRIIITYGSANYPCFKKAEDMGIRIISFPSHTSKAFERRNGNE